MPVQRARVVRQVTEVKVIKILPMAIAEIGANQTFQGLKILCNMDLLKQFYNLPQKDMSCIPN